MVGRQSSTASNKDARVYDAISSATAVNIPIKYQDMIFHLLLEITFRGAFALGSG